MSYRMPAEWENHAACWMAWPCRDDLWENIALARQAFTQVAQAISRYETVLMVCPPGAMAECKAEVGDYAEVIVWSINDSWTRDSGPTFVKDERGQLAVIDWQFNGWGERFTPYDDDALFAQRVAQQGAFALVSSPLVAEGGAFHVDGEGTLITTEQCLLNANRNPKLSRQEIEQEFSDKLGVSKTIWLAQGLVDDHTDGHVDELACFVAPGHVLALTTDDKDDSNYAVLRANYEQLCSATDAKGRSLKVTKIQQPEPRYLPTGERMSLSYINFYMANGAIIMAQFGQPDFDRAAKDVIQGIFPERDIVQVPALDIFKGGGGIHCITQQQPS